MVKSRWEGEEERQKLAQPYDTTFKDWIRHEAREVLPLFLPGAVYEQTLDVEIIRPTMRVDKVFKILYKGKDRILNLEFETGSDPYMASRLSAYNAVLYHDYHIPVISMIVYPFRTKMAESPLRISEDGDITTFHFLTLPLFTMEAEHFVREHLVCMYPLLPVMRGTSRGIIKQVMNELATLYRDDEVTLAQQFVWMKLLLERTDTIPAPQKRKISEELTMYDRLIEESPWIQKMRAESKAEGKLEGVQQSLITVVKARFPDLVELAQRKAAQIDNPDILSYLVEMVAAVPDEAAARILLRPAVA